MPALERTDLNYVLQVLETIRAIRKKHSACTLSELARYMRQPKSMCHRSINRLAEWKLVTWTEMPGSLRLTELGGMAINRIKDGKIVSTEYWREKAG